MSNSRWFNRITLALASLVAIGLSGWAALDYHGQGERERKAAAKAHSEYADHQPKCINLPSLTARLECVAEEAAASHEEEHTEADLRAQLDMATWAFTLMLFSAGGFLTSIGGIVLVYQNLVATREIGQNQARAFVSATQASLRVHTPPKRPVGSSGAFFGGLPLDHTVTIRFGNTGDTPAIKIDAVAKLWVDSGVGGERPVDLEFDQQTVVDAIVKGTDIPLFFKLPSADFRPPRAPRNALRSALADDFGFLDDDTQPESENLLASFLTAKTVRCVGEILYTDMFGFRFRTQFHFEYWGNPSGGDFPMRQIHGGLKMFDRVPSDYVPNIKKPRETPMPADFTEREDGEAEPLPTITPVPGEAT